MSGSSRFLLLHPAGNCLTNRTPRPAGWACVTGWWRNARGASEPDRRSRERSVCASAVARARSGAVPQPDGAGASSRSSHVVHARAPPHPSRGCNDERHPAHDRCDGHGELGLRESAPEAATHIDKGRSRGGGEQRIVDLAFDPLRGHPASLQPVQRGSRCESWARKPVARSAAHRGGPPTSAAHRGRPPRSAAHRGGPPTSAAHRGAPATGRGPPGAGHRRRLRQARSRVLELPTCCPDLGTAANCELFVEAPLTAVWRSARHRRQVGPSQDESMAAAPFGLLARPLTRGAKSRGSIVSRWVAGRRVEPSEPTASGATGASPLSPRLRRGNGLPLRDTKATAH